jgi:hypothetical protein
MTQHNLAGAVVNDARPLAVAEGAMAATSSNTGTATNGAVTLTFAADDKGRAWKLSGLSWSLSADPGSPVALTVADGATTIWQADVTAGGPGFIPLHPPIRGTANTAMTVTLAAAGASIVGKLNARPVLDQVPT